MNEKVRIISVITSPVSWKLLPANAISIRLLIMLRAIQCPRQLKRKTFSGDFKRFDNIEWFPTETTLSVWHDRPEPAGSDVLGSRKPSIEHDARFPTTKICSHKNPPGIPRLISFLRLLASLPALSSSSLVSSFGIDFSFCSRDTCMRARSANDEENYKPAVGWEALSEIPSYRWGTRWR